MKDFEIIVLGSGPGGYVAAIRAAQLGFKVLLIEKENLGGVCLNWGCIPTKAILKSADIIRYVKNAKEFGINIKDYDIDFDKIINRSRKVALQLSKGIEHLLRKNNIEVAKGTGKITSPNSVEVNGKSFSSNNIIIATGARPKFIKGLSPKESDMVWGYKEALSPNKKPKKLLIIGGGAIGVEFASFYKSVGADVTLLELQDRILVNEDEEISAQLTKSFMDEGIEVFTSAKIENFTIKSKNIEFSIKSASKIFHKSFDAVISAIGVEPNIQDIGLENTNIQTDKYILTDKNLQTAEKSIYAIGDVTKPPLLAHKASNEAVTCVEFIAGKNKIEATIPSCVYCYPQIASVGYTQKAAEKKFGAKNIKIGKFPLTANGKAIAMEENKGFIKVIIDKENGEILGVHMIGTEVTEIIHSAVLSQTSELTDEDILQTIFPHPTISEALHEAVLNAAGKGLHY